MKLLPHYFKWIGLVIFLGGLFLGLIGGIGSKDFIEGMEIAWGESVECEIQPFFPEKVLHVLDFTMLIGLLLYILSKNKTEDEFAQKLRYESAFIVLALSILIILVVYILRPDIKIEPSFLISSQMFFYLILRSVKRKLILET